VDGRIGILTHDRLVRPHDSGLQQLEVPHHIWTYQRLVM
jgi:hypothetical protein